MHTSKELSTSSSGELDMRKVTSNKADANMVHNTENNLNKVTLNNETCQQHMKS